MCWECQQCSDFLLCFKCYNLRDRLPGHLGHDFVRYDTEEDLERIDEKAEVRTVESEEERDERSSEHSSAIEDGGDSSDHEMDAISDDSSV